MGDPEDIVQRGRRRLLLRQQRPIGGETGGRVEVAGEDARQGAGDAGHLVTQERCRLRSRPRVPGVEVRVEPAECRPAVARSQFHPGDHARDEGAPCAAPGFLRRGAEPEVSPVEQLEAGGAVEHAAHFAGRPSVVTPRAEERVVRQSLTQECLHEVQAFLGAEQVGVEAADPLHDPIAPAVPDIRPIEDFADAEIEGHHAQFPRGGCGPRLFGAWRPDIRDWRTRTAG